MSEDLSTELVPVPEAMLEPWAAMSFILQDVIEETREEGRG